MTEPIYREVNSPSDITKINEEIREEIKKADSRDQVTELKRMSRYLVTLLAPDNPTALPKSYARKANWMRDRKRRGKST
ncbi:MAG: hypothetical protein ACXVIG_06705 [Halobacteriota archaeon]